MDTTDTNKKNTYSAKYPYHVQYNKEAYQVFQSKAQQMIGCMKIQYFYNLDLLT